MSKIKNINNDIKSIISEILKLDNLKSVRFLSDNKNIEKLNDNLKNWKDIINRLKPSQLDIVKNDLKSQINDNNIFVFEKLLQKNVIPNHILNKDEILSNKKIASCDKITFTMFRFEKTNEQNIQQNNIAFDLMNQKIKELDLDCKIVKTNGLWLEDGILYEEPGFTIYGEDIVKFEEVFKNIMSNLENFGLDKEHSQQAVLIQKKKEVELAFRQDNGEYKSDKKDNLKYLISIEKNEDLKNIISTNEEMNQSGATEIGNSVFYAFDNPKQLYIMIDFAKTHDLKYDVIKPQQPFEIERELNLKVVNNTQIEISQEPKKKVAQEINIT